MSNLRLRRSNAYTREAHLDPSAPFTVDGDRGTVTRAPLLGEHTAEVLGQPTTNHKASPAGQAAAEATLPLDGIRVLDLTQVWAGPYAGRFFADMGADVIHIEGPAFPDAIRGAGTGDGDPRALNKGPFFNELNRNKRGLSLDLQHPDGLETFRHLVQHADVVLENWSAGVAERLGIGYADLRQLNPRISLVQMPGFGQSGAEAERVGFGPTIEQMGGLVALQGYEGGPPHQSGISYGDPVAGTTAAGATAMALLRREHTGEGSHVVVVQRDTITAVIGEFIAAESLGQDLPVRIGNRHPEFAPHNVYRTKDDSGRVQGDTRGNVTGEFHDTWIAIAVDTDEAWEALTRVIDDPALRSVEFATAEDRRKHQAVIDAAIGAWVRDHDPHELAERLQAAGVSASAVLTPLMLARDPHLQARGFFPLYDHPDLGKRPTTRPVWRLRNRPFSGIRRAAPCFGQHNHEVLRDVAAYEDEAVERLIAVGVVTDAPQ